MIVIYAIENYDNGKKYIGCTAKPSKRWREHRCLLRAGKHTCEELQADWFIFGEVKFGLRAIYQLFPWQKSVDEKREAELFFMDWFEKRGQLYKQNRVSFEPPESAHSPEAIAKMREKRKAYKPTPESNLKRRLAQLGIPKGHGAKISATKQACKNK